MVIGSRRFSLFDLFLFVFGFLVILVTVYPFLNMVAVSLSKNTFVVKNQVTFYPRGINLRMYEIVLRDERIGMAYMNTLIYVAAGTLIAMLCTTTGAYALSKKRRLVGYKYFNIYVIVPMFFGGGMIPTYLIVNMLGLVNTRLAVILPPAVSIWNMLIMRSFFLNFPAEMEEAGKIDGLGDVAILARIVLPVSQAVLATISLFYAVGLWNSFFTPFIYLNDASKYPLQVILRQILLIGQQTDQEVVKAFGDLLIVEESLKYAVILVSILPIMMVYPFIQKYFVKGVMLGSLKG